MSGSKSRNDALRWNPALDEIMSRPGKLISVTVLMTVALLPSLLYQTI